MKSINFYILTILVFLISTAQSEDNPDLNLASSGGAVIIQDGGSEVDKFLKSKGWKKNKRNTKSNGPMRLRTRYRQ